MSTYSRCAGTSCHQHSHECRDCGGTIWCEAEPCDWEGGNDGCPCQASENPNDECEHCGTPLCGMERMQSACPPCIADGFLVSENREDRSER